MLIRRQKMSILRHGIFTIECANSTRVVLYGLSVNHENIGVVVVEAGAWGSRGWP